jgi:hypothetical protein
MLSLNENLITLPERSLLRIIIGITGIICGAVLLFIYLTEEPKHKIFMIFYSSWMIIFGLIFLYEGTGRSIENLMGDAFVKIDPVTIRVKSGVLKKETTIEWKNVDRIEFKLFSIQFFDSNGNLSELKYDNLEFVVIQKVKQVVSDLASAKKIPF